MTIRIAKVHMHADGKFLESLKAIYIDPAVAIGTRSILVDENVASSVKKFLEHQ